MAYQARFYRRLLLACVGVVALLGCQSFPLSQSPTPFQHSLARDQIILHSDFSLETEQRLIEELTSQREWVTQKLRLASSETPIHVYLFAEDKAYYDFIEQRFPGFANRRAIFVDNAAELSVYAHWGDHVAEDLRHEVSHGYLHAAVPHLPLWLDEGLAEYFEVGSGKAGLNRVHVDLLHQQRTAGVWRPELAKLERLESAQKMSQIEYAEAWAWVHFLLESEHDLGNILLDYLAELRQGAADTQLTDLLSKRLAAPELALQEHLEGLR